MKIVAKISSREVLVQCSVDELQTITGKTGYLNESDIDRTYCVNTTIGLNDSFNQFKEVANSPERLAKVASSLRDEADRLDSLATKYERIITPPVKAAKA